MLCHHPGLVSRITHTLAERTLRSLGVFFFLLVSHNFKTSRDLVIYGLLTKDKVVRPE